MSNSIGHETTRAKCARALANWMSGLRLEFDVHGAPSTQSLPRSAFFPSKQGSDQASTCWGRLTINLNLSWFEDELGFGCSFDLSF
jgi:hypothetical protein